MRQKIRLIFILFMLNSFILLGYLVSYAVVSSSEYHIVKRGETLYRISKLYGVSTEEIRKKNDLPNEEIYQGQKLLIPQGGVYHEVKRRQTLWSIARIYYGGVSAEEIKRDVKKIMEANDLPSTEIKEGRKLFIPGAREVLKVRVPPELSEREDIYVSDKTESVETERSEVELGLCWPIKGEIVRYFDREIFNGIDITALEGATIVASADGEVYWEGWLSTYGRTLIIFHKNGVYTCYMHNSFHLVKEGDVVKKEEPIAKVGSTGNADNPCLHFEVRKGTQPVNPLDYLP